MELFTAIATRASAIKLGDPAPSREHLLEIMKAGAHAPDHGKLAPWQFVVIEANAREVLGNVMAATLLACEPATTPDQLARERDKVMRAPCIITVAARVKKPHKIPEIEQILAAGAAAQNMFLAAHAFGYGVMWKTGAAAYDPAVKRAIGLQADDHIVGFIYLGAATLPGTPRAAQLEGHVQWLSVAGAPPP